MTTRLAPADEAVRRARGALEAVIADGRRSRTTRGLTQQQIAVAMRCSRQLIGAIERGQLDDVGVLQLARYSAIVGLDLSVRAFPATRSFTTSVSFDSWTDSRPCPREVLADIRIGRQPAANGLVFA
jgi:transcriptional regulator with XRE-family HTH domain